MYIKVAKCLNSKIAAKNFDKKIDENVFNIIAKCFDEKVIEQSFFACWSRT